MTRRIVVNPHETSPLAGLLVGVLSLVTIGAIAALLLFVVLPFITAAVGIVLGVIILAVLGLVCGIPLLMFSSSAIGSLFNWIVRRIEALRDGVGH